MRQRVLLELVLQMALLLLPLLHIVLIVLVLIIWRRCLSMAALLETKIHYVGWKRSGRVLELVDKPVGRRIPIERNHGRKRLRASAVAAVVIVLTVLVIPRRLPTTQTT